MNKYAVINKATGEAVVEGCKSREEARNRKRELEQQAVMDHLGQVRPSQYFVETGVDHPNGPGIYLH